MGNVIDNLINMKELTQMMVALAYSDLFYEDTNLKNELEEMHNTIKEFEKENLKHVFKIRESDDLRINIIELMEYVKDISNACRNMAVLNSGRKVLPFSEKMIGSSVERAFISSVRGSSVLCNKSIEESKIRTRTGASIKGIKKNGKWNFSVNKNTVIKSGDLIFAVGDADAKKVFAKVAEGTLKKFY